VVFILTERRRLGNDGSLGSLGGWAARDARARWGSVFFGYTQTEWEKAGDAFSVGFVACAEAICQFFFFQADYEQGKGAPTRQHDPEQRRPGEKRGAQQGAKHSCVARVPHMSVQAARKHFPCAGKLRVADKPSCAEFSLDANK